MQSSSRSQEKLETPVTPCQSVIIRSLRRRLWKALVESDITSALRAYTISREGYEKWLDEEIDTEERLRLEEENLNEALRKGRRQAGLRFRKLSTSEVISENKSILRALNCDSSVAKDQKAQIMREEVQWNDVIDFTVQPILQIQLNPCDEFISDDFYGPYESYNTDYLSLSAPSRKKDISSSTKKKRRGPRFAGFLTPWKASQQYGWNMDEGFLQYKCSNESTKHFTEHIDEEMTTLMHEVSRIASADFIRLLFKLGGNPNTRDGQQRTALHMVAGGISEQENRYLNDLPKKDLQTSADIGIRAPLMDLRRGEDGAKNQSRFHKKAARAMCRMFINKKQKKSKIIKFDNSKSVPHSSEEFARLTSQRMDALLAILSWVHPDDGTSAAGEGASINSVDARGRTALHYAAELGRADVALTILTSFGAILTVVDDTGRTPCELAAKEDHPELAAQLEARALLYTDPWVDEEIIKNIWGGLSDGEYVDDDMKQNKLVQSARPKLAQPFSWFETWEGKRVRLEREQRVVNLLDQMKEILLGKQEQKEAKEFMYNHGVDDSIEEYALGFTGNVHAGDLAESEIDSVKDEEVTARSTGEQQSGQSVHVQIDEVKANDENVNASSTNHMEMSQTNTTNKPLSEFQILSQWIQQAHVEQFAAFHSWDIIKALNEFRNDPLGSIEDAGIEAPDAQRLEVKEKTTGENVCLICCDEVSVGSDLWVDLSQCNHSFCLECLRDYVSECARTKDKGVNIGCPHHNCSAPILLDELLMFSRDNDVYQSLLKDADEKFVSTSKDLCFCPHPGCNGVVKRILPSRYVSKLDPSLMDLTGAVCTYIEHEEMDHNSTVTYEGVKDDSYIITRKTDQPRQAHRFCFACGSQDMHWPVSCEILENWREKVAQEISGIDETGEIIEDADQNFNDVAQRLWLKANTRPCPKCKAPIEKNDGCNHMVCSNRNCRHEFCWICREDWKLHTTETGGFFRCNRWQDDDNHKFYDTALPPEQRTQSNTAGVHSSEANYGTALHSSRAAWKKSKEMGLFLHHYRRWTAHKESAALERQMADTVCARLAPVVEAAIEFNGHKHFDFGGKGLSFIHAAFTELLECRSFLQHSYAFSFFRYPFLYHLRKNRATKNKEREKLAFEQLQSELETVAEQMSDIVARKHIRATQMQIMFMTNSACEKRHEFNSFMLSLLNEQIKETNEEAKRAKKEKKKQTVDRTPNELESILFFPPGGLPSVPRQPRDMNSDEDNFLLHNIREDREQDQQAFRNSLHSMYNAQEHEGRFQDWPCNECTYMNAGGRRCAMCGAARF
mmetsp:Transcript_9006/g.13100  ORF Transcript_9006/g.13100 Transcript_9006/m.13100 type:complete len:1301 (-) Transcript_9006:775-4677(-)|eukprot:CAMPEP_0194200714 /NCGR_PEP_ID=MMETSP0156-20130528/1196_1 /TAXON_ID=33649 /ORGANISM="Thalassionema nitzschioides, Strain L26-B" /LENGTH=1300 /DNA_ID=CAMNT_0038925747 /DNA_START=110 /DNA_END=4012 /DNA_ORIENTATION=-